MSLNYDLGEKLSKSYYFLGPKTPLTLGKFPWDLFFLRAYFLLGVELAKIASFAIFCAYLLQSSPSRAHLLLDAKDINSFVSLTSFDPDLNHTASP